MDEPNYDTSHDDNLNPRDRRITIAGARRMLGMISCNYNDQEVMEIVDILYGMAERAYDDHNDNIQP